MADGMTTDVYRRIFLFLLIFFYLHSGRRRLCSEEAFPIRVYIYHSLQYHLLICYYQGTESAPQTLSLCSTLKDKVCVFQTASVLVFYVLIRSPTLAAFPCNSVVPSNVTKCYM